MAKAVQPQPETPAAALNLDKFREHIQDHDNDGKPYILVDYDVTPEGDATGDESGLSLPQIKLLQALTPEVAEQDDESENPLKAGMYLNPVTMEQTNKLRIVPLYKFMERFKREDRKQTGSRLICASRDGKGRYGLVNMLDADVHRIPKVVIGDGTGRQAEVGNCSLCMHKEFIGKDRPECNELHWLIVMLSENLTLDDEFVTKLLSDDEDDQIELFSQLFCIQFQGASLKTFNEMSKAFKMPPAATYAYEWELGVFKDKRDQGTFYNITASKVIVNGKPHMYTKDERIVLRSLSKLAARVRPVKDYSEVIDSARYGLPAPASFTEDTGMLEPPKPAEVNIEA